MTDLLDLPYDRPLPGEARTEDRELTRRLTDERYRAALLARSIDAATISLVNAATLLGDEFPGQLGGPKARRLMRAVKEGRLLAAGDLRRLKDGQKRNSLTYLPISHDAFADWLAREGDPDEQQSAAATWAAHNPA